MQTAGIISTYAKNEDTLAAIYLADALLQAGINVEWLAPSPIHHNVHSFWNKQIRKLNTQNIYKLANKASKLYWFHPSLSFLRKAKLAGKNNKKQQLKHIYLPGLHYESKEFSKSVHAQVSFNRKKSILASPTRLLTVNISSNKIGCSFLIVLDAATIKEFGIDFLDLLEDLFRQKSKFCCTLLLPSSYPRNWRKRIRQLYAKYRNIKVKSGIPYCKYGDIALQHDWVYLPALKYNFGSLLALFTSYGRPILCHDIAPVGHYIQHITSGQLIPCELDTSHPSKAVLDIEANYQSLVHIVNQHHVTLRQQQLAVFRQQHTLQQKFKKTIQHIC